MFEEELCTVRKDAKFVGAKFALLPLAGVMLVAVLELCPVPGRSLMSPRPERVLIDPEGERSPADQGVVVLLPVADAVCGRRGGLASGHRGCGGSGWCAVGGGPIAPVYRSSPDR